MKCLYWGAFGAAFSVVGAAHASDPDCWLRTMGTTQAVAAGVSDVAPVDSGRKNFDPVTKAPTKVTDFHSAFKANGNASAYVGMGGYSSYGDMCLKSSIALTGNAQGVLSTAGTSADFGFNTEFQDRVEFWNPSVTYGQNLSWRICMLVDYSISGLNSSSTGEVTSTVKLEGFAPLVKSYSTGAGQEISCFDVTIANGDSLALGGTMKQVANASNIQGSSNSLLSSCSYIWIESLDKLGKFSACSGYGYTAVPEPGTLVALAVGGAMALIRRKKK